MFPVQRISAREALKLLDSCSEKSGFTTNAFTQPLAGAAYYYADKRKLSVIKPGFKVSKIKICKKQYPESAFNDIMPSAKEY